MSTQNETRPEPLRGLDRAAQEGRRNWNLQGKHATAYTKENYREAYNRGWNECQSAYEEGRTAAQSEDGSPGNPYHGADPDDALAYAYALGVASVIAPEFVPQGESEPANFIDNDPDGGH